ncbi:MAG: hypothetical protein Q8K64_08950 [Sediminibacterium sp.]|nr:hypothetical protein [Sediminibacterium sp.]
MFPKLFLWLRIVFFNLLFVAFIGLILRYKILFSLPFIDQKHLLHGHSHFAFTGWVTQVLMVLLIANLSVQKQIDQFPKYTILLYVNLIAAYGMLIAFTIQGYAFFSILFSTLSIFVSFFFAVIYWKDLNKLPIKKIASYWFKAALLFNAISSIGAFALAIMMANKIVHQNWYLLSVYFFLHFQYNGWFFFACMGLMMEKITAIYLKRLLLKKIFWLFAIACIPAYFLSALWLNLFNWVFAIVVISALLQGVAWYFLLTILLPLRNKLSAQMPLVAKWLLSLSAIALSIKLFLQIFSTIPSLSELAFGFRPIVIGYLHLILLGVITLFIIGYIVAEKFISLSKLVNWGIVVFTIGVLLNECFLMIQGVTALSYIIVPYMNEALIFTAAILFTGLLLLNLGIKKQT